MDIKEQLSSLVETERVNKRVSVREFTGSDELDDLAEINDADDDDIECWDYCHPECVGWLFLCHSVVYGQAIPSVIGQKSVALTLDSIELYKHQHI